MGQLTDTLKVLAIGAIFLIIFTLSFYPAKLWLPFQGFFPVFLTEESFWQIVGRSYPFILAVLLLGAMITILNLGLELMNK